MKFKKKKKVYKYAVHIPKGYKYWKVLRFETKEQAEWFIKENKKTLKIIKHRKSRE